MKPSFDNQGLVHSGTPSEHAATISGSRCNRRWHLVGWLLALLCGEVAAVELKGQTKTGTPVVHMWECSSPNAKKRNLGYTEPRGVVHSVVLKTDRKTGGYNHHSKLIAHNGLFYAMWSNHSKREDGAGQRVLYSTSKDGRKWMPWMELAPPPVPQESETPEKLWLAPVGWLIHEGRLWAWIGGYSLNAEMKTYLYREVTTEGTPGPILSSHPGWRNCAETGFSVEQANSPESQTVISSLQNQGKRPRAPQGIDSDKLNESIFYQAADGRYVCLSRDEAFSHRLYVSITQNLQDWPLSRPSDIPDAPSMTVNVQLSDGTVLLVGNQVATEFDNGGQQRFYDRVPLVVSVSKDGFIFDRAYAIRTDSHRHRVDGVAGRGEGGGQYPSALVQSGRLYVLYSMAKEDIAITEIPLSELMISNSSVQVFPSFK